MIANILNIWRIIQKNLINYFIFITIFQQIRYMAQKIEIQKMIIIFIENKYILPKDIINAIDKYFFLYLFMVKGKKNIMEKVVLSIYKNNIQIRKNRDFFTFY